jgi:SPP1 gp7 family putative phage head morphogenesis protein
MTPSEYLRELASAITRAEDVTDEEAQQVLFELALRIYALLQSRLPATSFERQLVWPQIRRDLLPLLVEASDRIYVSLYMRLTPTEVAILRSTVRFYGFGDRVLPPRRLEEVTARTEVLRTPLFELFTPNARTGVPPFAAQLLRLLERSVLAAILRGDATGDIAATVIGTRTRAGRTTGVARKGTVANAWRERTRAVVAAALWGLVAPSQERVATAATAEGVTTTTWRWEAILDPRTCPICRPLDGTTAPRPSDFPSGPPPLHPLCRCVVIPTYATSAPVAP